MKHPQRQQGFVLVTALVFLIVLSALGIMALRSSLFDERMASNDRDRALAREYAEMALRDAERDVMGLRFDGQLCAIAGCDVLRLDGTRPKTTEDTNFWNFQSATNPEVAFQDGGRGQAPNMQGVYTKDAAIACGMPVWSGANWEDGAVPARACAGSIGVAVPTVPYGRFTNAPFVGPDGAAPQGIPPPRYLIEIFPPDVLPTSNKKAFFRITAVGFGRTAGPGGRTSVTLQSVFSPL